MDDLYHPKEHVRIVTAASLFDGHDAAINIMRRLLQKGGAEIIHLGHNITAQKVADAAIQEDAHSICLSSYQGGHMEYFKYIRTILDENNAKHIKIFGGGGGVILPSEVTELHNSGIEKIYTPEDGQTLGLEGIISDVLKKSDYQLPQRDNETLSFDQSYKIASKITDIENSEGDEKEGLRKSLRESQNASIPVLGITGTGGAGKSSLTDELLIRFLNSLPEIKIAIVCIDPTRKKTGGALLGDRIRMNSLNPDNIFMRSMASRDSKNALSNSIEDTLLVLKNADFDLIIIETSGIGQGDTSILDFCDCSLYVMTPEFGAQSQLEKIGMLDEADIIAINKLEKLGGEDALRDVKKQYVRNHDLAYDADDLPIFGTTASQFNNEGVSNLFEAIYSFFVNKSFLVDLKKVETEKLLSKYSTTIIPAHRIGYLGEIAACVRNYHSKTQKEADSLRYIYQLSAVVQKHSIEALQADLDHSKSKIDSTCFDVLAKYDSYQKDYKADKLSYKVRNRELFVDLNTISLSGTKTPKVALPNYSDWGDQYTFMNKENLPGHFPFTAGVFPFKRKDEDPKRQFAGEGGPKRTNKRFHYLCDGESSKRISTAFDSVTLYGEDPQTRPDIYGKIGESGVSICSMQDMADLFEGFELIEPSTSVSMTINGPAPIILAMFLNTAVSQQMKKRNITYDSKEYIELRDEVLQQVRGTVQADILKEDQAQNTCIFSVNFALKMMGDVQEYFTKKLVKNFYSVSISGYHIAEAGANPISQVAFTMANGFTLVEAYLARDLDIDEFAPNLSFFFSNGMDPEYSVIGRVARRIWAVAMRDKYGANPRSQKLKYHIQTSGRSLHAQEIQFNDIRTTLQALMAIYDNCNSLHTNAYDEAITTPTEESVRRAMAIQLIITKELGLAQNENSLQGSFIINELTDLVEEAILLEFERISRRGGVLGAMETQYQRAKIQEESMLYESRKSSGELPIIGVNTYLPKEKEQLADIAVIRASYDEKDDQINRLKEFHGVHEQKSEQALQKLKEVALSGENIFEELMETVKVCSLGEITHALYQVGGEYRRSM
ncbi:MAG: cobalamin-dependent protein [Candidatus Cloacimonetes bacterium]|nr:cobalamin-dependent protein [Candidatus Cloacimonadota bacterium]